LPAFLPPAAADRCILHTWRDGLFHLCSHVCACDATGVGASAQAAPCTIRVVACALRPYPLALQPRAYYRGAAGNAPSAAFWRARNAYRAYGCGGLLRARGSVLRIYAARIPPALRLANLFSACHPLPRCHGRHSAAELERRGGGVAGRFRRCLPPFFSQLPAFTAPAYLYCGGVCWRFYGMAFPLHWRSAATTAGTAHYLYRPPYPPHSAQPLLLPYLTVTFRLLACWPAFRCAFGVRWCVVLAREEGRRMLAQKPRNEKLHPPFSSLSRNSQTGDAHTGKGRRKSAAAFMRKLGHFVRLAYAAAWRRASPCLALPKRQHLYGAGVASRIYRYPCISRSSRHCKAAQSTMHRGAKRGARAGMRAK